MSNFLISVTEQGLVQTNTEPDTDRLLIIGPALDGPSNTPVRITSMAQAVRKFGPINYGGVYTSPVGGTPDGTFAGNDLLKAYKEAVLGGATNIWLCRVGGTRAVGDSLLGGAAGIKAVAVQPGLSYNDITVDMTVYPLTGSPTSGQVTITAPSVYGGTMVYPYDNIKTIQQLINTVNSDPRNLAVRFQTTSTTNPNALAVTLTGSCTLCTGTYGTAAAGDDNASDKYKMYTELTRAQGTFDAIQDFETDQALLVGIYADDQVVTGSAATTTSVAQAFGAFCNAESRQHPTKGFIGLRPLGFDNTDPERVYNHILANLESTAQGYIGSSSNRWLKFGYFINNNFFVSSSDSIGEENVGKDLSIVFGPDILLSTPELGFYNTNPVAYYAGLISALPSQVAGSLKPLVATNGLGFTIQEKQLNRLVNGMGYDESTNTNGKGALVCLRMNSRTAVPEVVADVTFAADRSLASADLQPQRVVGEAIRLVKRALEPFLGEAINTQSVMAMEAAVRQVLTKMSEAGKFYQGGEGVGFDFRINAEQRLVARNEVGVEMTLWPALQLKRIRISTIIRR